MQAYVEVIFERPLYVHVGLGTPTHYSFRVAQRHDVVVLRLCVCVCVCVRVINCMTSLGVACVYVIV